MASLDPRLNPGPQWGITIVPGLLFDFLVKLPLIISDILVAVVIYRMVYKSLHDERTARSACILWFLNPLVIWVSAAWGMFDTLPALFTILAVYFTMEKKFLYGSVALVVAIAMKYYALVLVFPLLLLAWKEGGKKGLIRTAATTIISLGILLAPSFSSSKLALIQVASGPALSSAYYSGLSIWTIVALFSTADVALLSSGAVALSLLLVYYHILTKRGENGLLPVISSFALPLVPLLLLYTFVGENFLVWLMPFAAILGSTGGITRRLCWSLSTVGLISSFTDSLLPFYFLPVAPWVGGILVTILGFVEPYRVAPSGAVVTGITIGKVFLASLSIASCSILLFLAMRWAKSRDLGGLDARAAENHSEADPGNEAEYSSGRC